MHGFTHGADERRLAAGFRKQAEDIESRYPRLAATMLAISKRYEGDAERKENRAPFDD